jgi:hypothetical protein
MSLAIDPSSPPNHTPPNCNKFFPTNLQMATNFKQFFLLQTTTNPHTQTFSQMFFGFVTMDIHGHPAILNQMPLLPPQLSSPKPHEVLKFEPPC